MELWNEAGIGALDLDSDFISFDVGNSLILINPFSLFYVDG